MSIANGAQYLRANHAMAGVAQGPDVVAGQRQPEAGPAGAGIVLVLGAEQGCAAADATVGTVFLVVDVLA